MNTILLSEPIEESAIKLLEGKAQVVVSPDPSDATVGRLLEEADALILRTATRVTRQMLQKARRLKVVSRTGGGLNNVDVEAATDHRVVACGVKGPQDRYVAEQAVRRVIAVCRDKGIIPGIHTGSVDKAKYWIDQGMKFVAFGTDIKLILQVCKSSVKELRSLTA